MNRYLIGIDTGGTFTDGVLLDYANREVISAAKSLTTRKDLKQGVIKVLQKLTIPIDCNIKLVGISSTLATNSIAEEKARKVALLLIGYKPALVKNYGLESDFATTDLTYIKGGHNAQGTQIEPLDKAAVRKWISDKKDLVDAVAVSGYFSPLNPTHEKQAFDIISEESGLPVVMGHQLSTKLNSVKRAATASINASLVPVMQDFLQSVSYSIKELKIEAPIMVVRGDGTLMPYEEALQKPVESVLSGPAASAIGGKFLSSDINKSLVIDMGSTTTDMALVENSRVVVSESGAKVGDTETAVEAASIRTISLGCDSRIELTNNTMKPVIGPDRVRALSQISSYYPYIKETLKELEKNNFQKLKSLHDLEFWHLHQPLDEHSLNQLDQQQKAIIEEIREPQQLSLLIDKFHVCHPEHLKMHELIRQGFVECSFLNSTDLLHSNGNISLWDKEAADIATTAFSKLFNLSTKELIEKVFDALEDRLIEEVLLFMAGSATNKSDMPGRIDGKWGRWLLKEILYHHSDLLSLDMTSKIPIIGSGAPARHFMKDAARLINTKCYLPKYSEVANAVGAVSGSVSETREAIVFIRDDGEHYTYQLKYNSQTENYDTYEKACEAAEAKAHVLAREATLKAGSNDPYTEVKKHVEGSLTRFTARSAGNPKISEYVETINS
ncbi:MAG: hydantoinase/oxoprolinase family protein [Bacteroidales bacterium]|nr:hydantoinase/oxoprolinase family protein [Bacteroidales bacterium]